MPRHFRLADVNKLVVSRTTQGTPHNIGRGEALQAAGHEIKESPPKVLAKTRRKFGKARAEKQRKAILLSKARKMGARIPRK